MTPGPCPSDPHRDSVPGDVVDTSRSFLATHLRSILSFWGSFLVPWRSRPRWHFFPGNGLGFGVLDWDFGVSDWDLGGLGLVVIGLD